MKNIKVPAVRVAQIEIESLWGKKHILWDVNPDINILAGVNGIGKSSILNRLANELHYLIKKYECERDGRTSDAEREELENLHVPGVHIRFEPDAPCMPLDYLRIGDNGQHLSRLLNQFAYSTDYRETFYDVADELFGVTEKTVVREGNEILFHQYGDTLSVDSLSSGEKQMLIILLTVLSQQNQPAVLIMDEPEISLHIEWQQKLIATVRRLNPNAQLFLTTHSPAIIMDGWMDKVTEVTDITIK